MLPDTWFFNPTCELAIANGSPFYTAPARLRQFEHDLGYLVGWLGEEKDQVLVSGKVDHGFSLKMRNYGFKLPDFISLEQALSDPHWLAAPKGRIRPWGWSPALCRMFKNAMQSCLHDFRYSAVASWRPAHKMLYSRLTAKELLRELIEQNIYPWMPIKANLPVVCTAPEQIYIEIGRHARSVVKTPWSASGRGLLLFPNVDSRKKNDELLAGMLSQQGFVTVETWLDKVMDLSFQFYSSQGKIDYKGRTIFETDPKGRYTGNLLEDTADVPPDVAAFLEECTGTVVDMLSGVLSRSDYARLYEGWIGVDALIFRSGDGNLKFHPMIEINGRYTMGAVALKMRDYLAPGSKGFLQLYYSKSSNFQTFCQGKEKDNPLIMNNNRIVSGFLPLTPSLEEHHFGAYIEVGNDRGNLAGF
jgi:hypothetical protein